MLDNIPFTAFLLSEFQTTLVCPMDGTLHFTNKLGKEFVLDKGEDLEIVFLLKDSDKSTRKVRIIIDSSFPNNLHEECSSEYCRGKLQ